ncbi:MAG: hypothetical protein KDA45_15975 [Planctomycetales bacterium]|nr:hypothetical protein [Planctomycetales bacterium]
MWAFFWILCMLGLIVATVVTSMREKKAQAAAREKLRPKPLAADGSVDMPGAEDDGFGEADPLSSFGDEAGEVAALDENTFK